MTVIRQLTYQPPERRAATVETMTFEGSVHGSLPWVRLADGGQGGEGGVQATVGLRDAAALRGRSPVIGKEAARSELGWEPPGRHRDDRGNSDSQLRCGLDR
ncbi:hypothetical protein ACFWOB_12845 [Streptomyces sp. NPDC058420]|uniref:hypothetical protein n=1 Tax=Streptomyces sp. NPDC058420 TaxID=3346489 RepID=UPI00365707AE